MKTINRDKILSVRYFKKYISWFLALMIVLPFFFVAFSPPVFARLRDAAKDLGDTFTSSSKYAFVGIDPETGTEVFFFDGSDNIKITDNNVTDANAHYDEPSNSIVYQSLIEGKWQIFLYNVSIDTTIQLSHAWLNNTAPQISQNQVVWQAWEDGFWEIYFYDGSIIQRLTFNETPDIEPQISNGYITWRYYDGEQFNNPDEGINSKAYEVILYNSFNKEQKRLTTDEYSDNWVSLEYPYVIWQKFDGHDNEIAVHYILTNTTSFLTDNDHEDLVPTIKNGKIKWFEDIEVSGRPRNLVEEGGETKLKPQPLNRPSWWDKPLECPRKETVCTYVDGGLISYANMCFAEKAGATVIHEGICTGEEEIPTQSLLEATVLPTSVLVSSSSENFDNTTSESAEFTISPETKEILPTATPLEVTNLPIPILVSPSENFDGIVSGSADSPTPSETEEGGGLLSEPGSYENTASFNEEGDLIIEEHIPVNLIDEEEATAGSSLPIIEESSEPTLFEESATMQIGEAINDIISSTVNTTANIITSLLPGDDAIDEDTLEVENPIIEIEVTEEPLPVEEPIELIEVVD